MSNLQISQGDDVHKKQGGNLLNGLVQLVGNEMEVK